MTRRATLRGAERTPLDERADVLICGASFAGLAVARELAGAGADVLVVDRYEIGERQTSACAAPTPWLRAMGVEAAIRQELPCMAFHTPHGSARFRLPWSWSSFDYRTLCEALWAQCGDARFEVAKVERRDGATVLTDRGPITAELIVDALGWRRVLGPGANVQPPDARISRGLEVHPEGGGADLDVWIDRSLIREGYAWSVPAAGEQRVGVGSYEPRDHVKEPTKAIAGRLGVDGGPLPGQLVPARPAPGGRGRRLLRRGQRRALLPALGRGDPHRLLLRHRLRARAGPRARRVRPRARRRWPPTARSRPGTRRVRARAALQRLIPALPPRALTALLAVMGRERPCRRAFSWYLEQAHPRFAVGGADGRAGAPRGAF